MTDRVLPGPRPTLAGTVTDVGDRAFDDDLVVETVAPRIPLRERAWARLLAGTLLAGLLSAVGLVVITSLWSQDLHVPFQYATGPRDDLEDATLEMMITKDVQQTGWYNTNPYLNAPFQQRWAEWPMGGDIVAYTIKKGLLATTGSVPLADNLFWLLTFPMTAMVAYPVLRVLRCSHLSSLMASFLFSLAPYHFRNGMGHENLAFYVAVPFIVLFCVQVLDRRAPVRADAIVARVRARFGRPSIADDRSPIVWPLIAAAAIGVTGLYYLGFFLVLMAICAALAAIAYRRVAPLVATAILGGAALFTAGLANLPTVLFRHSHPKNMLPVGTRSANQSEAFPVRLVELLSPIYKHRLPYFNTLNGELAETGKRAFQTANLGLITAIGFVVLLLLLPRLVLNRGITGNTTVSLEARLGILVVAALLVAEKGGISRLLASLSFSEIRAWVRITIVIAFASIVVVARLLDRWRTRMERRTGRDRRVLFGIALLVVCVVGVLDQTSPWNLPSTSAGAKAWANDDAFVHTLEAKLPRNAMVFQLPVADFPEGGNIMSMPDYANIQTGYLHSRTLRWSAGGVKGREGEWQFLVTRQRIDQMVNSLAAVGFSSIVIDRYGFKDEGQALVASLTKSAGAPMLTSRNRRLVAFDLRPAAAALHARFSPSAFAGIANRTLYRPRIYLTSTFAGNIVRGGRTKPMCTSAQIELQVPPHFQWAGKLIVSAASMTSPAPPLKVMVGKRGWLVPADTKGYAIPMTVDSGVTKIEVVGRNPGLRCSAGTDYWYQLRSVDFSVFGDSPSGAPMATPA